MKLVLIPQSFPFGVYADFLRDEVVHLARRFDSVVVAPTDPSGSRQPVPENVTVDLALARRLKGRRARLVAGGRSGCARRLIAGELADERVPRTHPASLVRLVSAAGLAAETARWAAGWAGGGEPVLGMTVWLGPASVGLHLAGLQTISRAHRADLFIEAHPQKYLPLHRVAMTSCERVYSVSSAGASWLCQRYPELAQRISVRRLGTRTLDFTNERSADGTLRVVSCSSLTAPKRPWLLAAVITSIARRGRPVEWHHFGNGPLMGEFRSATSHLPASVRLRLHGQVPNESVLAHYAKHPVDVFVNVSESEGVPVSIMECASVGIPIVATDAGGTGELVTRATGRLLETNSDAATIAECIWEVGLKVALDRRGIRECWRQEYSADRNYARFADEIAALTAAPS